MKLRDSTWPGHKRQLLAYERRNSHVRTTSGIEVVVCALLLVLTGCQKARWPVLMTTLSESRLSAPQSSPLLVTGRPYLVPTSEPASPGQTATQPASRHNQIEDVLSWTFGQSRWTWTGVGYARAQSPVTPAAQTGGRRLASARSPRYSRLIKRPTPLFGPRARAFFPPPGRVGSILTPVRNPTASACQRLSRYGISHPLCRSGAAPRSR